MVVVLNFVKACNGNVTCVLVVLTYNVEVVFYETVMVAVYSVVYLTVVYM